jgi:putative endonuclease
MIQPAVYIVTNKQNGTLYTGVTSCLPKRIYEHKEKVRGGFTKKYGCNLLVFLELHDTMLSAIAREKQIKKCLRKKKLALIEGMNPSWKDLSEQII